MTGIVDDALLFGYFFHIDYEHLLFVRSDGQKHVPNTSQHKFKHKLLTARQKSWLYDRLVPPWTLEKLCDRVAVP